MTDYDRETVLNCFPGISHHHRDESIRCRPGQVIKITVHVPNFLYASFAAKELDVGEA
jgi:hypothetical protein